MHMLRFVEHINWVVAVVLTVAYLYQGFYLLVGLVRRRLGEGSAPCPPGRYAAVIAARNEQAVIRQLIASLRAQNYPSELLDIYVVADNCTDATARTAREAGAFVYERFDQVHKGKGYAMDYLFRRLRAEGRDGYDAYLIFDADNLVDPNFVCEMNKTFRKGYDAVTCYRNSKNFGDNWISAGYSVWFLREARFLNLPRMLLGTNCAVSGTGFLVSAALIRENGGWPFHLLTEDIQFSVHCAVQGKRIGYCHKAVVYDEQPTTFRQSWDQRLRWSKGFYQVDVKYGLSLLRGCLRPGYRGTSCYDMLMTVAPGMLLTLLLVVFNAVILTACLTQPPYWADRIFDATVEFILGALVNFYAGLFLYGLITVLSEWGQIRARWYQKLGYLFTFPLFMFTYIPISLAALVRRVEWKPIYHSAAKGLGQMG